MSPESQKQAHVSSSTRWHIPYPHTLYIRLMYGTEPYEGVLFLGLATCKHLGYSICIYSAVIQTSCFWVCFPRNIFTHFAWHGGKNVSMGICTRANLFKDACSKPLSVVPGIQIFIPALPAPATSLSCLLFPPALLPLRTLRAQTPEFGTACPSQRSPAHPPSQFFSCKLYPSMT